MDGPAQHPTTDAEAVGPGAILGEYTLGARLERRGHADVYEATVTASGAPRLVYVLLPAAVQDHPFVHQVICEVDAARWLRHAAVAKVDGYGDAPGGGLFVAADLPPGRPLGVALAEGGRMSPRRVVRMAHRLVEAIEEAHAVGLVHGRLAPSAVLVADESDPDNPLLTLTGFGTGAVSLDGDIPAADQPYVSPERLAGRELDARADVYGLASLLHHALVGVAPTGAASAADLVPPGAGSIAGVIAAARSVEPKRRPATVKAFWEDLLAALVDDAAEMTRETPRPLPVVSRRLSGPMTVGPLVSSEPPAPWPILETRADILAPAPFAPAPFAPAPLVPAPLAAAASAPAVLPFGHDSRDLAALAAAAPPARASGGVDVFASGSLPALMAAPAPIAAPAAAAVPAPSAAEDDLAPPPTVPFRETWERHRPTRTGASISVPPTRRRRTALAMLWWLAVPAAAAAASWPLTRDGGDDRPSRISNSTAAFSIVPGQALQPMPATIDTGEWSDDASEPMADSLGAVAAIGVDSTVPAAEVEDPRLPTPRRLPKLAPVAIPSLALPNVELAKKATAVRSSDFPSAPPDDR